MTTSAHRTEGVNRTQTVRLYPFVFTGKERDEETGYGYFGARYMDYNLMTMWLSVDPMADKYPSMSPYNYCAWNPVKIVDPNGEELYISGISSKNHSQTKLDILSLVHKKNRNRISFDDEGKISIDLSGLSQKQIKKMLYKDKGLALLNKMSLSIKKMLYECSDDYIDGSGETHDMVEQPDGVINASNNGPDSKDEYTHTPPVGFDGYVVLAKSGKWERRTDINSPFWEDNKTSLLFHELDENYYRTVVGDKYKNAHDKAVADEGFHYGNLHPGKFFSKGVLNRYSYKIVHQLGAEKNDNYSNKYEKVYYCGIIVIAIHANDGPENLLLHSYIQ